MASRRATTISYYFFVLAVLALAGSLAAGGSLDLIFLLFAALGLLVRSGGVGRTAAQAVCALGFIGVVVTQLGALIAIGEPARIGLFGRVFTGESPAVPVAALGAAAVVAFLVPWLALATEKPTPPPPPLQTA